MITKVTVAALHLRELFDADPHRGRDLTVAAGDLNIDYSKHRVTRETLELARTAGVEGHRDAMFAGRGSTCPKTDRFLT